MADPLSVIAGVIGICSAAVQASATVVDLVRSIKDAPREIQTILTDLDDFKGVVSNLNSTLQDRTIQDVVQGDKGLTDAVKSVAPPLTTCATEMTQLKIRLTKNLRPAKDESGQQRINSATWYWKKGAVVDCMSRLQSNKLNLNIALSSVVSYCTLYSYAKDSRTLDLGGRRNSTDTDAGSALKLYATSIICDTSSGESSEESFRGDSIAVETLQGNLDLKDQIEQTKTDVILQEKLLNAVEFNRHVLVEELITQGVDLDYVDADGHSPLQLGAINGCYEAVALLLRNGANPNLQEANGEATKQTPLRLAISGRHEGICQLLISHGANVNAISVLKGHTPLVSATIDNQVNIVNMLLEAGADTEMNGFKGHMSPLFYAVRWGKSDIVQILIRQGADIEAKWKNESWPQKDLNPLMLACVFQRVDIVDHLGKAGVKIDTCLFRGYQAIHITSGFGDFGISESGWKNIANETTKKRSVSILNLLLDLGADIESKTKDGLTPLMIAAAKENIPGIEFLLSRGANVDVKDVDGHDFLWHAQFSGRKATIKMLEWIKQWRANHPERETLA